MRNGVIVLAMIGIASAPVAHAASRVLDINGPLGTLTLGNVAQGGELLVRGLSPAGKTVNNQIIFRPGANAVRVNTSWIVGEEDAPFRLIGVNVDLLDNAQNLIASDTFQGILAGTATSTIVASGLVPGARYHIVLTGTAIGRGSFSMSTRPGVPAPP